MNPIINPSGSAGQSFKGLHAYCVYGNDRTQSKERCDWMSVRNFGTDDPHQAWKIMVATAAAQNDLKAANGIRRGDAPKDGAVMHVVLAFAEGEPTDQRSMEAAADEFLTYIGADPSKSRAKSKGSRKQFADEHQVIMYAHNDTGKTHLHLMINRIHPEHGILLPDKNDQTKAQNWALKYTKRHGTDHLTPAREENANLRAKGEYVKGERRKSRNVFEMERELAKTANDNQVREVMKKERAKDSALSLRGRNMEAMHGAAREKLVDAHEARKASLARQLKSNINKARAENREQYRPKWRDLQKVQESERKTFAELERSFFGRTANVVKVTGSLLRDNSSNIISRSFKILSNAGERKVYFEKAQERARTALKSEQAKDLQSAVKSLKATHGAKLADNRAIFFEERQSLEKRHDIDRANLKQAWNKRTAEKEAALDKIKTQSPRMQKPKSDLGQVRISDDYIERFSKNIRMSDYYNETQEPAKEQDNSRDRDDGQER